eukprot:gene11103-18718_t
MQAMTSKAKRKALRKKFRPMVPEGVDVAPSSPLLRHYRKNLTGGRLVYRLAKRQKMADLRDIVLLYEKRTLGCSIAIAAVLTQLYRCQKWDPNFSSQAVAVDDILKRLFPAMATRLTWTNLRVTSVWLWAAAGLKLSSGDTPAMSTDLVGKILARATQSKRLLSECSPRRLSLLAWSASKLLSPAQFSASPAATEALSRISKASGPKLLHFTPQGLANLATSLASLGVLDASLAASLAAESSKRIGDLAVRQFTPRDYTGLLGALASSERGQEEFPHRELFAEVAGALSLPGALDGFWPQQLASLSHAYAQAGMRHGGLMSAIAAETLAKIGKFHGWALEQVSSSFEALEVENSELKEAVGAAKAKAKAAV